MHDVLDQVPRARHPRRVGDPPGPDVAVDLLRPEPDCCVSLPSRSPSPRASRACSRGRQTGSGCAGRGRRRRRAPGGPVESSPSYNPRRKSSTLRRTAPAFWRTLEGTSFTAHVSPATMSYPAAAILRRNSRPASIHVLRLFDRTQVCQPVSCASAIAWKRGPSARIRHAWSGRGIVLFPASAGMRDVVVGAVRRFCRQGSGQVGSSPSRCTSATSAWRRQLRRSASGPSAATSAVSTRAVVGCGGLHLRCDRPDRVDSLVARGIRARTASPRPGPRTAAQSRSRSCASGVSSAWSGAAPTSTAVAASTSVRRVMAMTWHDFLLEPTAMAAESSNGPLTGR